MDEGRLVAGRYRLRTRLGSGAMGVVWQAFDERLGRVVALKQLIVPEGTGSAEAVARAAREGRIAARVQHPNAVTVHDVVEDGGRPVLVMEYVPARTLAEVGVLPPDAAARIGAQVASALAAAHAAGVVHRDVKPGNVLITSDGTAKISDFGIARAVGDVAVTRTGLLAGTPAYLSPEVARGAEPGPASDVFALGATLYAAVEGRPPFGEGGNTIALLHTVAAGRFDPPRNAGPLTGALMEALRTDPTTRPDMARFADLLRSPASPATPASSSSPASSAPPAVPTPPATRLDLPVPPVGPSRRRPVLIGVTALVVVGGVVLAVLLAARNDDAAAGGAPTSSGTTTSTTTSETEGEVTADRLQQTVADYYALLPDDTDGAWAMLGPGMREQGREKYDEAWEAVRDLAVTTPPEATGPDHVTVGLRYTGEDDERIAETRGLMLAEVDGTLLIVAEEVLSSERVEEGGGDDEGEGGRRGKDKEEKGRKGEG
ncbi:serine/threonine-protein kinase [Saccharothrix longispora]|uniref:non-specific serine/threonine protein kinase n=1 Tax=Saccharothrix longispora TaxID=33920 RepID=A0ABU1PTG7_9PSEU|nr:serine/threonine-protein kinase [Saccharothrix longispora]MDR6593943.1 serine/threonine protein kinase [Saccharothrix longispora]